MADRKAQTEFRWLSWLRAAKSTPPPPAQKSTHEADSALTAWSAESARSLGLDELACKVRVAWNPRMRTTAGRAWWPDRAIELNPKLRDFGSEEIWRTLKHELAHLVAYERCGRRRIDPHGPEWQTACADLGIAGESVTHKLAFKRRRMARNHTYACSNCQAVIHRVRPIKRPVACHECCRKFNNGSYHDRFRLIKNQP